MAKKKLDSSAYVFTLARSFDNVGGVVRTRGWIIVYNCCRITTYALPLTSRLCLAFGSSSHLRVLA